jgi:hypothetical protein
MAILFYIPLPGDPDATSIADGRLQFRAYEPTEIDTDNPYHLGLFEKLRINSWFGGDDDSSGASLAKSVNGVRLCYGWLLDARVSKSISENFCGPRIQPAEFHAPIISQ